MSVQKVIPGLEEIMADAPAGGELAPPPPVQTTVNSSSIQRKSVAPIQPSRSQLLARMPTSRAELLAKQNKSIAKMKVPPKKITFAEWIAYRIDQYISTRRGQIATLSLLGGLLIIVGAIFLKAVQAAEAFPEMVWESWTFLADPGAHTGQTKDVSYEWQLAVSERRLNVFCLLLGWSDKSISLIRQICLANASENGGVIVVLAEIDKEELEAELESQMRHEELRGTRVIFRTGTPLLSVDLLKVSAHRARSIIIMANSAGDADKSDAAILPELRDIDNDPLLRLVGGNDVEILVSHDVIGRLVLMSARSPGLARVYSALLGFEGNEFYFKEWPECVGVAFSGLAERFPNAIPLGIKRKGGEVFICPGANMIVEEGDEILVLAEDDDTYKACPPAVVETGKVPVPSPKPLISERILMCGWRRDIRDMIQLLDAVVRPGTELHMICEEPVHLRNKSLLDSGLDISTLKHLTLIHHMGNTAIRRQLEKLPWSSFTSIMILSDQSRELDIMHSDSHSLASLLLIRDLQARSLRKTHGQSPDKVPDYCKCISEILDPRTQRTISTSATILKLSEFIQSNELVSCILAMISESRDVRVILDELLGPQGAYFEVEPSTRYCEPFEKVSFWQLAKRAMTRGDILCGFQLRGEESTILNPEGKELPRVWGNVDMVVVRNAKTTIATRRSSLTAVNAEDFERTTKSRQVKDQISRQRLLSAIIQDADLGGGSDIDRTSIVRALSTFAEEEEAGGSFATHPASFTFGQKRQTSVRGLIAAARMLADALESAENNRNICSDSCDVEETVSAFISVDASHRYTRTQVAIMTDATAEEFKAQGNELYKRGDYQRAIDKYTQAIDAAPTVVAYYGNRAAASFMLGKHKDVVTDCNRAIVFDPLYMKGYVRKAKAQLALGDNEAAMKTYQAGLVRDPNNATLLNEKRTLEMALDKLQRGKEHLAAAVNVLDGAMQVCTGSSQIKLLRGEALIGAERYDEAFAVLTQLMRTDSSSPELLFLRARCLYFQGEFPSAIKHLQQALRSDPDNSKCMKEIKRIRHLETSKEEANNAFKSGNMALAVEMYTECLKIDPQNKAFNSKIHCNRANALSRLDRHEEAIKDCDKAIYYDHGYAKAYLRKAACLKALGGLENLEQALRVYDQASKLVGDDAQRDIQNSIRQTKLDIKKAKRKDYYKILNVSQNATEAEIKKSYKRMALKFHPDRHAGKSDEQKAEAEAAFKDVGEAYAVLSDAQKRQRYDSGVDLEDLDSDFGGGGMGGGMGGVDPSQIFQVTATILAPVFSWHSTHQCNGDRHTAPHLITFLNTGTLVVMAAMNSDSQKRLRTNEAGDSADAAETHWINEYQGYSLPEDNSAIERIPISSVTPEQFFAKYICTRTPVVLTGFLQDEYFTAPTKWSTSDDRLVELAGDTKLTVERRGDVNEKFGKGIAVEMPFRELLQLIASGDEMHYLTTQEVAFEEDGRPEIMAPFMKKLQQDFPVRPKLMGHLIPQNINMWMGNNKHGSSTGLHHDHHDNLYILMRGKKRFRLYSPGDAGKMYVRGRIAHVHPNGLINYVGKETTPYGAEPAAEREALAAIEKNEAERELAEAEQAVEAGEPGAEARLEAAEQRLEKAMFGVLQAENSDGEGDEEYEDGAFHFEESEAEGDDESEVGELDELALDPEEEDQEADKKTAKRDVGETEIMYPVSFSQVDTFRLRGGEQARKELHTEFPKFSEAKAAFCDLEVGDMLFLPASWFHEVESYGSAQGNGHLALNYWYQPPDQLSPTHFSSPYSSPFWERDWEQRFASKQDA
ncbi:unnamed protein product [Phytophthora fragariaefolia]|uniref:Unnamed protein product n=1 Tax=Phytophthora fragariaefolia TaxID=1490495 RepID=A0A9W6WX39_9STRA|nr:unnamed protein product [Phytophthora fragariaefolia]